MHIESPNLEAKIENIRVAAAQTIPASYAGEREATAKAKKNILEAVDDLKTIM